MISSSAVTPGENPASVIFSAISGGSGGSVLRAASVIVTYAGVGLVEFGKDFIGIPAKRVPQRDQVHARVLGDAEMNQSRVLAAALGIRVHRALDIGQKWE